MIALLSVVVPCYDEAPSLNPLYDEVMTVASTLAAGLELILVDDGSRDATYDVARRLALKDPRVRVIAFSRNFGKEAAMLAGLRAARGDAVVLMDADLQHPPALLARLVEVYLQGHDQVVARRTRTGDWVGRRLTARAYYRVVNRLANVPLQDGVGDFRIMSRAVVDALLRLNEANRFSKGLFSWVGFDTASVEYENVRRRDGRSRWAPRALVDYGVDGLVAFNSRPLRVGIWLGLTALLLSVGYVLWLLVRYLRVGVEMPGYLTTIAVIVGLGGVQLIFLGIIGEYIGRIYVEVKSRPHYIVRSQIDASSDAAGEGGEGIESAVSSWAAAQERASAHAAAQAAARVAARGEAAAAARSSRVQR